MYNIFKYKKYEKIKTENGWTVKSVLWNKNSDGEIAFKEELNSDKLTTSVIAYSDEKFKNIVRTSKLEYNEDKSYTQYDILEQFMANSQSLIGIFDNKKRKLSTKMYSDKNFENLIRESTRKYNKDGSFEEKVVDYISELNAIYYCNKRGVEKKRDVYDKNFKKLIYSANVKELKNGNFEERQIIFDKTSCEYYSSIEILYDSKWNFKKISEKLYVDNNFKKLSGT